MKTLRDNKKEIIRLLCVYIIVVVALNFLLKYLFFPIWGDMLLYSEEAKSLANEGTLKFGNVYGVTGAYLYPYVISSVYKYFYNAYTVIHSIRFLGILIMATTIFPAYLLLRESGVEKRTAVILAGVTICLPDMLQTIFIATETVAYPLFMWTVYVIYLCLKKECKIGLSVLAAVLCYMDYQNRSQTLVISLGYLFTLFVEEIQILLSHNKARFVDIMKKMISFLIPFGMLYVLVPKILERAGVIQGGSLSDFYLKEFIDNFLNNRGYFFAEWSIGFAWFFLYLMIGFGILPILIPFFHRKYNDQTDNLFMLFINASYVLTVLVVTIIIFGHEEPLEFDTHRVHARYFMYFLPVYIYMLYKVDFSKFKFNVGHKCLMAVLASFLCFGRVIYTMRENWNLGADSITLVLFQMAKEKLSQYPHLENWMTMTLIAILSILIIVVRTYGLKWFVHKAFPICLGVFYLINVALYMNRVHYITAVGQGDYVNRYAPIAEYLNQYEQDEVVVVSRELTSDNEVQSLRLFLRKNVDNISIQEIENNVVDGVFSVNGFDRVGYLYNHDDKHRILENVKCIAIPRSYTADTFVISNEIVYEDGFIQVYSLDSGVLHISKEELE